MPTKIEEEIASLKRIAAFHKEVFEAPKENKHHIVADRLKFLFYALINGIVYIYDNYLAACRDKGTETGILYIEVKEFKDHGLDKCLGIIKEDSSLKHTYDRPWHQYTFACNHAHYLTPMVYRMALLNPDVRNCVQNNGNYYV